MRAIAVPPRHPRRLVFLGTPHDAVPTLHALLDAGFEVPLVVSMPDRRRGRGSGSTPTPVKAAGEALGIPVTSDLDDVLGVGADLGVVVAYGRIISTSLLEQIPMVNLHFSLLPRWRGAAPVERAILAGDARTGVCVMRLEPELDTGDVYASAAVEIGDASAGELRGRLAALGAELVVSTLSDGLTDPQAQTGEATYAKKISTDDLRLDFAVDAASLLRIVRVGGAWTTFRGERFKVWDAVAESSSGLAPGALDGTLVGTGHGQLRLITVQPSGKPRVGAAAWANGARLTTDDRFGE